MDKQIAEMAKVLDGYWHTKTRCPFDKKCPYLGGQVRFTCSDCLRANVLIEKGYRKIPEGAVVLTREEYSDYLVMKDAHQNALERCEKLQADNERLYKNIGKFKDAVRKETAEKFAERLKERLDISVNGYSTSEVMSEIEDKIDEIAKEITEGSNG